MAKKPIIKSKITTKDKDVGYGAILKELKKLENKPFVKVGFPAEFTTTTQAKKKTEPTEGSSVFDSDSIVVIDENVTVLDVAIWNEFGTENIPERSFLRSAFDKNRKKYEAETKKMLIKIYKSEMGVERALDILGLMIENDIKDMIRNGEFEPNSIATVLRKGSDKPLIDTAQMLNSVRFKRIMNGVAQKLLKG